MITHTADGLAKALSVLAVGQSVAFEANKGVTVTCKRVVSDCWSIEVVRADGRPVDCYSRVFDGDLTDLPIGMSGREAAGEYLAGMAETFDGFRAALLSSPVVAPAAPAPDVPAFAASVQEQVDRFRIARMSVPCRRALLAADENGVISRDVVPLGVLCSLAVTHEVGTKIMNGYKCVGVQLNRQGRRIAVRVLVDGVGEG